MVKLKSSFLIIARKEGQQDILGTKWDGTDKGSVILVREFPASKEKLFEKRASNFLEWYIYKVIYPVSQRVLKKIAPPEWLIVHH